MPTAPELLDAATSYAGPVYMSPEQILGETADPRTDLFSLGVVLYELLAGERPFRGPDERSTSLRIRRDPPIPITRHVPALPPSVERIVQRCLEKMPNDRHASATELADALEAARSEIGAAGTEIEIRRDLIEAGLVVDRTSEVPSRISRQPAGDWTLAKTAVGLFVVFGLIFASGTAIQLFTRERSPGPRRSSSRLEPLAAERAYLRVVAHPWAHVIVDGQRVDTTPFARPIPLSAGTHYVRLEHPNAPTERRTVNLSPGETLLLDVNLKIERPLPPAAGDGVNRPLGDSSAPTGSLPQVGATDTP
jgi:serine/threonine-protein kinase